MGAVARPAEYRIGQCEITTQRVAAACARMLLGPRVRTYREADVYLIARVEMTQAGTRYRRIFGGARSRDSAVDAARRSYAEMRRHPGRTT